MNSKTSFSLALSAISTLCLSVIITLFRGYLRAIAMDNIRLTIDLEYRFDFDKHDYRVISFKQITKRETG